MKKIFSVLAAVSLFILSNPTLSALDKEPITNYEVLFSPQDHLADQLIALINKEKKSIRAAVFCLMHRGVSNALIEAQKRGVDVEIVVDPFSVKSRSPVKKMASSNIPIYVWNPKTLLKANGEKQKRRKPLMHDKFCVLGGKKVWTGSFNFTYEGTLRNRENVIVFENEAVAGLYLEEFERLKEDGCMSYYEYMSLTAKK